MNLKLVLLLYSMIGLSLIAVNDQETWLVFSGVLLVFEWQIVCAILFGVNSTNRLSTWKNIRVASHVLYMVILIGTFFSIKSWFPNANEIGLIVLGIVFLCLKELSLQVCKYKAITANGE